ncbi:MAG: tRNA (adenosine(37)-N6)-threonylcarbamoyltransferase complex ATPase subunit type 1 TsaE [Clostridiaceae bacterium]|nr:tRNA (adenosine(37)-N6)-threonylcarbamoyltransferase complex ATPase subunit type 1 TsaE [Clostridiaceae bacterium]
MDKNKIRLVSKSPEDTIKIAYTIGKYLRPGDVICLGGDLGAGKTAFTQGLAKGLGIKEHVTSPTFTIVNEYYGMMPMYHFDVYRINDPDEMMEIGFDEYVDGDGISVIEWAEKIQDILPPYYLNININKKLEEGDNYREIVLEAVGDKYRPVIDQLLSLFNIIH